MSRGFRMAPDVNILSLYQRDADKRKQLVKAEKKEDNTDKASTVSGETAKANNMVSKDNDPSINQNPHRRRRRGKKALETENTYHGSLLPKVPQSKIISHNISNYPVTTFPSSTNFPKIHNGPSMLPSIANTHYNKHHAGMKKSYQPPSKNVYGHYQLPSIHHKNKEDHF